MRRVLLFLVVAAGGAAAWWWWTAPPARSERALISSPGAVPSDADGVLLVADPARTARWAAGHPQALALLPLAAPAARNAGAELRNLLTALIRKAPDVLVAWWRGHEIAVSGLLDAEAAASLERAAALTGTPCRILPQGHGSAVAEFASSPALLEVRRPFAWPAPMPGERSALCYTAGRWWRVETHRNRLELRSGAPPELPPRVGPSVVATADLASLGDLLGAGRGLPHAPARLAFDAAGWAVALGDSEAAPELQRLLTLGGDAPADAPAGARHWRGVLGDLWVLPGPPLAVASNRDILLAVAGGPPSGELGSVRGQDSAAALLRLAAGIEAVPLLATRADTLRRGAAALAKLRLARWRLVPAGGCIVLEW